MSERPTIDAHQDAAGLDPVGGSDVERFDRAILDDMGSKTKVGLAISREVDETMHALSFVTGRTRSALVESAITEMVDRLPERERESVQSARSAARKTSDSP